MQLAIESPEYHVALVIILILSNILYTCIARLVRYCDNEMNGISWFAIVIADCKESVKLNASRAELLDHIANLESYIANLENEISELTCDSTAIFDVSHFKFRLQLDGLLTSELNDAIDVYMKYYNKETLSNEH